MSAPVSFVQSGEPALQATRPLPIQHDVSDLPADAHRAPVPVTLDVTDDRFPEPVEAAAYFVVSESLANVARYAHAQAATVRIREESGVLAVEVRDDGVGGADESAGTGLRGLADRVAALDGSFAVESPSGAGTRVRAEIPLG